MSKLKIKTKERQFETARDLYGIKYVHHMKLEFPADNNRIERLGGWDFLFIADELFTDCVQVDWGSFAYKCTKEQLIELTRKTKCAISGIELLKPEKIYGIVFIEEC